MRLGHGSLSLQAVLVVVSCCLALQFTAYGSVARQRPRSPAAEDNEYNDEVVEANPPNSDTTKAETRRMQHRVDKRRSRTYCGNNLVNMLSLVCGGIYHSDYKRSKAGSFSKSPLSIQSLYPSDQDDPTRVLHFRHLALRGFDRRYPKDEDAGSFSEDVDNNLTEESRNPEAAEDLPFIPSHVAMSVLVKRDTFRRTIRGAHDECCAKPCNVNEMRSYCAVRRNN